jgi:hypothetical protein
VEDEDEQNECLRPLEMDKMSFSTREFVWPRERERERELLEEWRYL